MTDIYLISGFLGAGKTTFMKTLIGLFKRDRTALIVNEFGQEGVDGALLAEEGMVIEEIVNGSIFCVCRSDKFIDAILKTRELNVDTLIVESSGLADPLGMDEVMKILDRLAPDSFHYSGSVCVVDANNFNRIYALAPAARQQVQGADLLLINKTDTAAPPAIEATEKLLRQLNNFALVIKTSFAKLPDPEPIFLLRWHQPETRGVFTRKTLGISKFVVKSDSVPVDELREWLNLWCANAYRVKGFCGKYFVQAVQDELSITEFEHETENNFLVVITASGDALKRELKCSWEKRFKTMLEITGA